MYECDTPIKTKILTKFQVCVSYTLDFTIYKYWSLILCFECKVVFLRGPPIKNVHISESSDDMIMRFFQIVSNSFISKVKILLTGNYWRSYDRGKTLPFPRILGRTKSRFLVVFFMIAYTHCFEIKCPSGHWSRKLKCHVGLRWYRRV